MCDRYHGGAQGYFEFEGLKSRIAESRTLIVQNFLNNLLLNKVDQESLWGTIRYYDIPLRRDTGALQCNGADAGETQ